MKHKNFKAFGLVFLLAVLLLVGVHVSTTTASSGPGEPDSGTVVGIGIRTYYIAPLTTVTESTTLYASSARETGSNVMSAWHSFDVFASLDISGTGAVTITPQISADNVNWADVTYTYVGTPLSYATTVTASTTSTTTATVTNTVAASGTPTVYEVTRRIILDQDGEVDYFSMPMTGYYLRFQIVYSATGTITPTVHAVGRND